MITIRLLMVTFAVAFLAGVAAEAGTVKGVIVDLNGDPRKDLPVGIQVLKSSNGVLVGSGAANPDGSFSVRVDDRLLPPSDRAVTVRFDGGQAVQGAELPNLLGSATNDLKVVLPGLYGAPEKPSCVSPYGQRVRGIRGRRIFRGCSLELAPPNAVKSVDASNFRSWKNASGTDEVVAKLVNVVGPTAYFQREDGRQAQSLVANLSAADQEVIEVWRTDVAQSNPTRPPQR